MSHPSLNAALKRLEAYALWNGDTAPNPYNDSGDNMHADIALVVAAMRLTADCAEHTDSRDAQPVFEVRLPCEWTHGSKGFLHALSQCRGRTAEDVG